MSIEIDVLTLVKSISAFYTPVTTAFSPEKTTTDPEVLCRLVYNQVRQDVEKAGVPYLYWTGPFNTDLGQTANGFVGTKKADFWFWCHHHYLTDAMIWTNAIQIAIEDYFNSHSVLQLVNYRLTSAFFIDRRPILDDQTVRSAKEFPLSRSTIGYTFGYQASSG